MMSAPRTAHPPAARESARLHFAPALTLPRTAPGGGNGRGLVLAAYPKCLWKNTAIGSKEALVERASFGT
jgi:hypothetical protein